MEEVRVQMQIHARKITSSTEPVPWAKAFPGTAGAGLTEEVVLAAVILLLRLTQGRTGVCALDPPLPLPRPAASRESQGQVTASLWVRMESDQMISKVWGGGEL